MRLTPVMTLALVSCGAVVSRHSERGVNTTVPARTSNTKDRDTFRNEQSAAPRVNNVPINP